MLERDNADSFTLQMRIDQVPISDIATTIVNYEEQMRGWLAYAAQANTIARMLTAYERLQGHVDIFRDIPILPFDVSAARELERLRRAHLHVGTMDLKIAAIALANNAILLTRTLSDFGKVPGLRVEDWSV